MGRIRGFYEREDKTCILNTERGKYVDASVKVTESSIEELVKSWVIGYVLRFFVVIMVFMGPFSRKSEIVLPNAFIR